MYTDFGSSSFPMYPAITTNLRFNKNGHYLYGNNNSASYNVNRGVISIRGDFNGYIDYPDEMYRDIYLKSAYYNKPFTFPANYGRAVNMFGPISSDLYRYANFNFPAPLILPYNLRFTNNMFADCDSFNAQVQFVNAPEDGVRYYINMFRDCANFNQPLTIYANSNCTNMLSSCNNFNSPVTLVGTSVLTYLFANCKNFNAPIYGEITMYSGGINYMFRNCTNFNQPITVNYINGSWWGAPLFYNCTNFNSEITLLGNLYDISHLYSGTNYNMPFTMPETTARALYLFQGDAGFNSAVQLSNALVDAGGMFFNCTNFNQSLTIPNTVQNLSNMFRDCVNLNQTILLPNSAAIYEYSSNVQPNMARMFMNCSLPNISFRIHTLPKPSNYNPQQQHIWSELKFSQMFNGVSQIGTIEMPYSFAAELIDRGFDINNTSKMRSLLHWSDEALNNIAWYQDY